MTENNHQHINPFYLCTGFHRSGTSLLAQSLAQGGMHMGSELMGASFSNPLGHVEDMPVVRLHDKIFEINGMDWRYHKQVPLVMPQWFVPYIQRYIADSVEDRDICGVKDPRAAMFLDEWEQAAQGNIRYILVYRHWAPSCFSILNRASKHLINSTAPLQMNKVNLSFWQQPEQAFNMWQANNEAILEFYLRHPSQCLLIAQDPFVNNNARVAELAAKIGLDAEYFDNASFEQQLMTDAVPDYFFALLSDERKQQLNDTWQRLQQTADVAATNLPTMVTYNHKFPLEHFGFVENATKAPREQQVSFNLVSLGWQEALGFTSQIPAELVTTRVFDALMQRPFTSSDNYQALAKITHKHGLYLYTKLCKMRAMQVEKRSWQVVNWGVFAEPLGAWLQQSDDTLEQANPFSLRFKDDLNGDSFSDSDIEFIQADWATIKRRLANVVGPLRLARLLEMLLLYRNFSQAQQCELLSQFARQHQQWLLAEFCLIKALRLEYSASLVMALGDIYNGQGMSIAAYQCFDEANKLEHGQAPILARLAEVCMTLGEMEKARKLLLSAQQLAPQHKIVQLCQNRMTQLAKQEESRSQVISSDSPEIFMMPRIENYQDVVDLTRQDRQAGEELDKYNQQVSFILRDNKQWLAKGLTTLSEPAARCLSALIYRNWQKLWPEAVVKNALGLTSEKTKTYPFATNKLALPNKLAIVIHFENRRSLAELISLLDTVPYQVDFFITCKEIDEDYITQAFGAYLSGRVTVGVVSDDTCHLQAWLLIHQAQQSSYDLMCKIHDLSEIQQNSVPNWSLQQVFCLLCSPNVEKIIEQFSRQVDLGMVVPGYHPATAGSVNNEESQQKLNTRANTLGLTVPKKMMAFPTGGMFWYRPQAMQLELQSLVDVNDAQTSLQLLVLLLKQQNYNTQCTHLL